MTITHEYGINGDKKLRYNLSESSGGNMSEMHGQRIKIKAYIIFEDTNPETNEPRKTLKALTEDGEFIGTRSSSFIAGMERFIACMESDEVTEFAIGQATSRNGRKYITFIA